MTAPEPPTDAMTDPAMAHPGCHQCRRHEASLRRLTRLRDRALRRVNLPGLNRAQSGIDENANRYTSTSTTTTRRRQRDRRTMPRLPPPRHRRTHRRTQPHRRRTPRSHPRTRRPPHGTRRGRKGRMSAWIGVDPGARWTGITAVEGRRVACTVVIDCNDFGDRYLDQVEATIRIAELALGPDTRVAIENFVEPTPHMGLVGVRELIATAAAVGHLTRAFPGAVLIRPNGHGHRPWATYPPELITKSEQRHAKARPTYPAGQSSLMRHARSAYDVALAAPMVARTQALRGAPA